MMKLSAFFEIAAQLLTFMGLPLIGIIIGSWLTNSFFPFRLKRREWHWEKELWARELFFESVSRIKFIADHYSKGEYEDKFSMSGLSLDEANNEIMRLVKNLHSSAHKIELYLDSYNSDIFNQYLCDSQKEYDAAKDNWGKWDNDNYNAKIQHTESTIAKQGNAAVEAFGKIKLS